MKNLKAAKQMREREKAAARVWNNLYITSTGK